MLCTWLALLGCFSLAQAAGNSDQCALEIQRVKGESRKLTAILEQVKKVEPGKIRFSPLASGSPNTGITNFETDGTIEVKVECGHPQGTTESLLAHELFHIVLRRRGFPTMTGRVKTGSSLRDRVLDQVQVALVSCYSDPLIDELLGQRGIDAKLTTRMKLGVLQAEGRLDPGPIVKDELWRKSVVLDFYCFSLRKRDASMSEIFQAYERLYPSAEEDTEALAAKVGRTRCKEAKSCMKLTKRLRDAAGFEGLVVIGNPSSGKLE